MAIALYQKQFRVLLLGVIASAAASVVAPATTIAAAPAFYPRVVANANGSAYAAVERPTASARRIVFFTRPSLDAAWGEAGVVAEDSDTSADLANPHVWQRGQLLLCAFRHHTTPPGGERVYRIEVAASHDGGRSWGAPVVVSAGATGVWEPFLFSHTEDAPDTVRAFFAAEITNGGEQDIVERVSIDAGKSWGANVARLHTAGSRNGMPGAAQLQDGSVVVVFEAFLPGAWGAYVVNSARSFDRCASFPQRALVHVPLRGTGNAGSPQIGVDPRIGGRAIAVYMSNEPTSQVTSGGVVRTSSGVRWPDGAHVGVVEAHINATDPLAPLQWGPAPEKFLPLATSTAYWPSLFVESGSRGLFGVYQGGDSVAYIAAGAL